MVPGWYFTGSHAQASLGELIKTYIFLGAALTVVREFGGGTLEAGLVASFPGDLVIQRMVCGPLGT